MQQGTWTIRPCPHDEAGALAGALGISWVTASVLVRRGYGDPGAARAFLAAEPPRHDAELLGDTAAACDRIRAAIAAGERICVHGDYDVDGICATALAVSVAARARGERRLASPEPLRRGLRPRRPDDRAARRGGLRARPDRRLRDHRGRGGRAREGARPRRDRDRPPPSRRDASGLPDRRDAPVALSLPRALRHGRRLQAARCARGGRRQASRPRRARHDRRRRAAPRREPRAWRAPACARSRERRSPACKR